jgi:hypothetical protein
MIGSPQWRNKLDLFPYPFGHTLSGIFCSVSSVKLRKVCAILIRFVEQWSVANLLHEVQEAQFNEVFMYAYRPSFPALCVAVQGGNDEVWRTAVGA